MSFVYPHVSFIAILAAAVAQFMLGFIWYSGMTPIGRRWAAEAAHADRQPGHPAEMAVFPVSSIMAAWAVAMVYGWSGATGALDGIYAAWVVAFAVAAQVLAANVANARNRVAPQLIDLGYLVVGYALMGALFGLLA